MKTKNNSLLKDITLNWWEAGLFKTAAVSFGILLALYFGDIFERFIPVFWLTFLVPGFYILNNYFKK